jgi:C4-dicarboxylate-specific signal transduction histidine kinase
VENMAETIKDFTDFLKPNREKSEFDLTESINMALTLMETSLNYNNIYVELKIDPNLKLLGYQNEFSHVLFNILNNARDAIVESKTDNKLIKITGYGTDENIILEITNMGEHISEDILKSLFEPYFTTKGEKDGTGIGLYISKIIVEQRMNGTIELKNVDSGVCCRICIKSRGEVN